MLYRSIWLRSNVPPRKIRSYSEMGTPKFMPRPMAFTR
ncbi:Uncharacterised protein [Bordetella pertussis]|nr:Uncharacterised protein [Bordetella pertussis]